VDLGLLVAEQHKGEEQAVLVLYPKKRWYAFVQKKMICLRGRPKSP
jgi:hypothetical protein